MSIEKIGISRISAVVLVYYSLLLTPKRYTVSDTLHEIHVIRIHLLGVMSV